MEGKDETNQYKGNESEDAEDTTVKSAAGAKSGKKGTEADGVTVPEEFQRQAHALVHKAPKSHLNHLRDRISMREEEMRDADMKNKKSEFSTEGGPASLAD